MQILLERCPWPLGGVLLGLVVVGLQWTANLPIGMTGAFASWLEWFRRPKEGPSWRVFFFCGVAVGAFVFSKITHFEPTFELGSFDQRIASSLAAKAWILPLAGLLVGFGTRLSGGCTSGHGLCGISRGSQAGLVSTAIFFGVAALVAQFIIALSGVAA